jgi:hypothetical protein
LGEYVANSNGQTKDVIVTAVLFLTSTLLPTVLSLVVMGLVSKFALNAIQEVNTAKQDGFTDSLIAEEVTADEITADEITAEDKDVKAEESGAQ